MNRMHSKGFYFFNWLVRNRDLLRNIKFRFRSFKFKTIKSEDTLFSFLLGYSYSKQMTGFLSFKRPALNQKVFFT